MNRYDTAIRCTQIKNLIEDNQYLKAMEEIEELDFARIPSITDIYLFADLFLRAEKMDVAKELYYTVYRRTASRPALYRLLMLVIRMGDVEEAGDLYLTYEIIAGMTLDTYELRYRLAKAEGASCEKLIEILEQLKHEEYTEEWGLQLAKLYELQGMREQCIQECEDIKRWFGEGSIVDKAMELRERCLRPDWVKPRNGEVPEPETPEAEPITQPKKKPQVAHAPVTVEDIAETEPEKEPEQEPETEEVVEPEQEPEPEEVAEPEPEQEQEPEEVAEPEPEQEKEPEEVAEPEPKQGFLKKLVNYFKVDLEDFGEDEEEFPEELDTYKQQSTVEINVKAILAEGVGDILEEETLKPEPVPVQRQVLDAELEAKPPVESLDERLQEIQQKHKVIRLDDTMNLEHLHVKSHPLGSASQAEIYEDVSPNGIHYLTLKGAIYKLHQDDGLLNFALTGGAEGISLAVAKKLFKELKKINYFEAKNIGKITASKLDEVDLEEWAEKFIGGCMYIMDAPELSDASVGKLLRLIERYGKQIVIILEGSYDEMDAFLKHHVQFEQNITYKIKL